MNLQQYIKNQSSVKLKDKKQISLIKISIDKDLKYSQSNILLTIDDIYSGSCLDFEELSQKISNLYNVYVDENNNSRSVIASIKTYSKIAGSSKKPRPQKGQGRSRQGDKRSPIVRGGSKVFGPNPNKKFNRKINKKSLRLARNTSLILKYIIGDLFIVSFADSPNKNKFKTKYANLMLNSLDMDLNLNYQKFLFISCKKYSYFSIFKKIFNNLSNVSFISLLDIKLKDLLANNVIFLDFNILDYLKYDNNNKSIEK